MSEEPSRESAEEQIQGPASGESPPSNFWLKVAVILLVVAAAFGFIDAWREHRAVQRQAVSSDELRASLRQARSQIDALTTKLNAMNIVPAVAPAEVQAADTASLAPESTHPRSVRHASQKRQRVQTAEDLRWKHVEAELAEQQKLIDEHQKEIQTTQQNVQNARTELERNLKTTRDELSGSIAKTHDELVALEKKGERNYYEFDLPKAKHFKKVGPLGLSLRKANSKREYCDLEMIVNDNQLAEKHVNLYQPVLLYPEGYAQPLELVINHVDKDTVHGYVSEPKYKPSELAARSGQQAQVTSSSSQGESSQNVVQLQRRTEPQQ
jgi:hypothetical protein